MSDGSGVQEPLPSEAEARRELSRQNDVLDMMISMQASLRDWNKRLGTALTCLILSLSVLGLGFAFAAGGTTVQLLGVSAQRATWLGWLSVFTAALTLTDLVLDLRGAARKRADAVARMSELKTANRASAVTGASELPARSETYHRVMSSNPEIPNALFNRLKAAHYRKVEISRIISRHPGLSYWSARRQLCKRLRADLRIGGGA